jgi:hypothetical protein
LHDWSVHLINTHDPLRGHVLEHVRRAAPEQPALHGGTKVIGKTEAVVSSERTACFEPGVSFAALGLEGVAMTEITPTPPSRLMHEIKKGGRSGRL